MATPKKTTSSTTTKKGASKATKKTSDSGSGSRKTTSSGRASAPRAEAGRKRSGPQIASSAAIQLAELTSKQVEAVTGLERTEDGWKVEVEVLELRRIPNTTDVLALYEVIVDADGDLEGYQRRHRFVRGAPQEDR